MAIVAGDDFVTAEQFVFGIPVVVECRLVPGDAAAMAGVALIAAMLVMRIIFEMAGDAGLVHLVFKRVFRMAIAAGQFCVAT